MVGCQCIVKAAEEIERLQGLIGEAGGGDRRKVMADVVKTLFISEAPVKVDANFLSAVAHVGKRVNRWLRGQKL